VAGEEADDDRRSLSRLRAFNDRFLTDIVRRYRFNDVERCIAGRCVGARCPCLCHVESLRLAHYDGNLVRRRGRIRGVSLWRRGKGKKRPT
jgi:hypothetical protein